MLKFINEIYSDYRVNVLKYSTISSLAFAIFRVNFLKDSKIPLIQDNLYEFIKKSYTGGSVDVFKPISLKKEKIYGYDINSQYPYVMANFSMPIGNPIIFEGDILSIENKPFGFFEVEITSPLYMKIPLLQTNFKNISGFKNTIAPLGK